jgi:hypothetical protein
LSLNTRKVHFFFDFSCDKGRYFGEWLGYFFIGGDSGFGFIGDEAFSAEFVCDIFILFSFNISGIIDLRGAVIVIII